MKILDEVRYDIFRGVLAAVIARVGNTSDEEIAYANRVTEAAVKRLEELGIVGAAHMRADLILKDKNLYMESYNAAIKREAALEKKLQEFVRESTSGPHPSEVISELQAKLTDVSKAYWNEQGFWKKKYEEKVAELAAIQAAR